MGLLGGSLELEALGGFLELGVLGGNREWECWEDPWSGKRWEDT